MKKLIDKNYQSVKGIENVLDLFPTDLPIVQQSIKPDAKRENQDLNNEVAQELQKFSKQ